MKTFITINTVSDIFSISLFVDDKFKDSIEIKEMHSHTKFLATNFNKILLHNNVSINSLNFIAIVIGPGSFSGIKAGVNFVKGICFAVNIPVISINQFESFNNQIVNNQKYYVALFSHRDNIYYQLYENGVSKESAKCGHYTNLDSQVKVYGYMLDKINNFDYELITISSKDDGEFVLKKYSSLLLDNANNLAPIYLNKIQD